MRFKEIFLLVSILCVALILRIVGLNWDQGFHLHPDERAIVLFTLPLRLPATVVDFFTPASSWNPHFFAYGSFPLYVLKIVSTSISTLYPSISSYDAINLLGRGMAAGIDVATILIIFFLGKKLFSVTSGFIGSFFYTISVFPIQNAHFYTVDALLTCFALLLLYQLIRFYENPTIKKSLFIGILFGITMATKTSALVLLFSIIFTLSIDFLLIFLKKPHVIQHWFPHVPRFLQSLFIDGLLIFSVAALSFFVAEPYAAIDFPTFWQQQIQQSLMTHNAFTFPYTLQYVGIIPYWYEVTNIFLWGQGPVLASLCFAGIIYISIQLSLKEKKHLWAQKTIIVTFFWTYFFVVGNFSVAFMRYMLPLYPILCLFGAVFTLHLYTFIRKHAPYVSVFLFSVGITSILLWPMSFLHIYTKPNTRVLASSWITEHIPQKATLGIEHWDDSLPLYGLETYTVETLPLYDPDTKEKWEQINHQLSRIDYLIIASNRLYTPLQKLTDCTKLPIEHCYPLSARYYKELFAGKRGFTKIAEFSVYPRVPFTRLSINDQTADESFTVYDHPRVMIFKHIR